MTKQQLVTFGGMNLPANADDLVKGLENVSSRIPEAQTMPFLRLGKDGYWVYGQENIEVEEGSEWAAHPHSIQHGMVCWGDGEILGEVMVPFNQRPPVMAELQDFGRPWAQQISVMLQCLTLEDTGQAVLYKTSSIGGRNALKKFIAALVMQAQHDPQNVVPVLSLDVDSYQHKKHGKTYVPVLTILRWVGFDGAAATEKLEKKTDAVPAASPAAEAATPSPAPAPAPEPPAAEPAGGGTRRRRRSAGDVAPPADAAAAPRRRRRSA